MGGFRIAFRTFVRQKNVAVKGIFNRNTTFKGRFINENVILNRNFTTEIKNQGRIHEKPTGFNVKS